MCKKIILPWKIQKPDGEVAYEGGRHFLVRYGIRHVARGDQHGDATKKRNLQSDTSVR